MADCAVGIVDDHPLMVEAMSALLENRGGYSLVAKGENADDVYVLAERYRPDVLIVDLGMHGDVLCSIRRAVTAVPDMKVVVFTASLATEHAVGALDAGAKAYVLKGCAPGELCDAISAARRGEIHITPVFASKIIGALQVKATEKLA
ncbi:response regulator, partial [Nostoc linckia]|uniref:response regulator n=1 Tax=Nostoc linckia TaxID=92942 RepID=UPI000C03005A